jgi:hypothetical protein
MQTPGTWRTHITGLAILSWVGFAVPAAAQIERAADLVSASLPPTASVMTDAVVPLLHVRWVAAEGPSDGLVRLSEMVAVNQFAVVARGSVRGPLVRERDPQWSEHDLVIVAADASGLETSWQKVRDPRILRSEQPGPTGELSGETFVRPEVELVVAVPDGAASLNVYETTWSGEQFVLRQLGRIDVIVP